MYEKELNSPRMKRVLPRQAGLFDTSKTLFENQKIPKFSLLFMFYSVKRLRSFVKFCFYYSKKRTVHHSQHYAITSKCSYFLPHISANSLWKYDQTFLAGKLKMTSSFCVNLFCLIKNKRHSELMLVSCSFVLRASKSHLVSSFGDFSFFLLLFVIVG